MKIRTVLTTKSAQILSVRPENSISEAIAMLAQYNIGAVIVLDEAGKLAGILSERDVMRAIANDANVLNQPVSGVMTSKVITGRPQDDLQSVMITMTERRFRHLPIMDDDTLIGIISIGDVVKAQMDDYQGKIDTLHIQITEGEVAA